MHICSCGVLFFWSCCVTFCTLWSGDINVLRLFYDQVLLNLNLFWMFGWFSFTPCKQLKLYHSKIYVFSFRQTAPFIFFLAPLSYSEKCTRIPSNISTQKFHPFVKGYQGNQTMLKIKKTNTGPCLVTNKHIYPIFSFTTPTILFPVKCKYEYYFSSLRFFAKPHLFPWKSLCCYEPRPRCHPAHCRCQSPRNSRSEHPPPVARSVGSGDPRDNSRSWWVQRSLFARICF